MNRLIYESGTKDPASRRQNKTEQTNLAAEFFRFKMKLKVGIQIFFFLKICNFIMIKVKFLRKKVFQLQKESLYKYN